MNCRNCNADIDSKFCPDCGQPAAIKRIDGHYITHEIEHVLHVDRGIIYTLRELLRRPGEAIHSYITENRSRLVKPIVFVILTSLSYTLAVSVFHVDEKYVTFKGGVSAAEKIFEWIQGHYGYTNILLGVFIALWVKLFFMRHRYNFFEILVLLCFVMGMGMMIFSLFAVLQGITNVKLMFAGGLVGMGYSAWAIGQFFGKEKIINYVKGLLAYVLGYTSFTAAAIALGFLVDLIKA